MGIIENIRKFLTTTPSKPKFGGQHPTSGSCAECGHHRGGCRNRSARNLDAVVQTSLTDSGHPSLFERCETMGEVLGSWLNFKLDILLASPIFE